MGVDAGARSKSRTGAKTKSRTPDYNRQRIEAITRDGKWCIAEVRRGNAWAPCCATAHATAHVYRRWLCGSVPDHVDVVIRTCVECHDKLDGRMKNEGPAVRFPLGAQRRAWDRIIPNSKDKATIGPRP